MREFSRMDNGVRCSSGTLKRTRLKKGGEKRWDRQPRLVRNDFVMSGICNGACVSPGFSRSFTLRDSTGIELNDAAVVAGYLNIQRSAG